MVANLRTLLLASWLARLLLILYGEWQDRVMNVKFTDIDYIVFSDASAHVLSGGSPYERATYRYTPILSWLLLPNHLLLHSFGKLLFITLDVVVAWIMYCTLTINGVRESKDKLLACSVWLFNPLTAIVSSRGNAESIMALLMLSCIYLLLCGRVTMSAVLYGLAVHTKLYPIIYAPALYLFINHTPWCRNRDTGRLVINWQSFVSYDMIKFTSVSTLAFSAITSLCYYLYGWEFLHETYLYHLTRSDIRHNFSLYFYMLYLIQGTWVAPLVSILVFLPQALLVTSAALLLHRDLPFCCFVQTFLFVTFNKVCTSQYFSWYLCYLPLIIPSSRITLKEAVVMTAAWFLAQGLWLLPAYLLEFQGINTFVFIWLAGVMFFVTNVAIVCKIILSHRMSVTQATKLKLQ